MTALSIERVESGRLKVSGPLDFDTAATALDRGLRLLAETNAWEIDLSGVDSSDSAGLAVLVEWLAYAQSTSKRLQFTGLPAQIRAVAAISEIDELLVEGVGPG